MKKFGLFLTILLSLPCLSQSMAQFGTAINSSGRPLPSQNVAVCTQPANTNTTPCSPLATLATGPGTTSGGANPLTTDAFGNYKFYAVPGPYTVQIYGPQVASPIILTDVNLGPSLSTNNIFTGSNTFGNLNNVQVMDGTKYVLTDVGFQAAINAAPGNSADIYVPDNTSVVLSHTVTITNKNLTLICGNRNSSIIGGSSGGAAKFTFSGTINQVEVRNCQFNGNSIRTFDMTAVTSAEGRWTFYGNWIENEAQGGSNYWIMVPSSIRFMDFIDNWVFGSGGMYFKDNSDVQLLYNYFEGPQGVPFFTTEGGSNQILSNTFLYGTNGSGTPPDILLKPRTATFAQAQNTFIRYNKFGAENEVSGRYKIQVSGDASTYWSTADISHNFFNGVASQKAIGLQSAIHNWTVAANKIQNASTFIDDTYTVVNTDFGQASQIYDNTYSDPSFLGSPLTFCTNGCRGFSRIEPPQVTSDSAFAGIQPRNNEVASGLSNLVANSENPCAGTWTINPSAGHITCTTGQTDPWGGTRGVLVTRAGTAASESFAVGISVTGVNQITVKFWAKKGTGSTIEVLLFDNTRSVVLPEKVPITLGAGWQQYKAVFGGVPSADSVSIFFYPDGEGQTTGTMTVTGIQASATDTDYFPTTSTSLTNTAGNRWELPTIWKQSTVAPSGAAGDLVCAGNSSLLGLECIPNNTAAMMVPLVLIGSSNSNVFRVSGTDFTSSNANTNLQTITGLSWVLPANLAYNYSFDCHIAYSQATNVTDDFGIQAASLAPTNIFVNAVVATTGAAYTNGVLPTLSTTTATNIVGFLPATTSPLVADLHGMIENPSGVANTINIMVSQSTAADVIVVKRGSWCRVY